MGIMKKNIRDFVKSIVIVVYSSTSLNAQDIHFSHMEFSPLTLNPALAGANSPLQAIVNYRSQWNSVAVPYQTIAASFDARFNENKRQKKGIMAGGINFFNDKSGDLKVSSTTANINLAYHLILDRTSTLGLGIYTGFGQKSIDQNAGRWGNQYNGISYDASAGSGESFNNQSFTFLDAGAGAVYTYKKNKGYMTQNNQRAINAGFAIYHINRPGNSFIDKDSEKLYMRMSAFANATIGIDNTRGSILPSMYIQSQKSSLEIFYGMYYKYQINEGTMYTGFSRPMAIYLGIFNRFKDAMVGKVMLEWDQFSTGFGYDINISTLTTVSKAKGGFEFFLRFNMGDGGGFRARI
jgi:type IX secretion system PorP/SprF family membrane protein